MPDEVTKPDHGAEIQRLNAHPLIYRDERCLTLSQMDRVHGRPDGTAGRTFRKHREKLVEGKHYFTVPYVEWSQELPVATKFVATEYRGDLIVLTQRGYLLLAKSFHDELAWRVQDALVDGYFELRQQPPAETGFLQLATAVTRLIESQAHNNEILGKLAGRVAALEFHQVRRVGEVVEMRLHIRKRWPGSTPSQRKRIVNLTIQTLTHVGVEIHQQHGRWLIERDHLYFLDNTLDDVRMETERQQPGLFDPKKDEPKKTEAYPCHPPTPTC